MACLILLGQIKLDDIDSGLMEGLMRYGAVSIVAWLSLAAAGIWYQLRDIGRDMAGSDGAGGHRQVGVSELAGPVA